MNQLRKPLPRKWGGIVWYLLGLSVTHCLRVFTPHLQSEAEVFRHADQQAHCWTAALMEKKAAMEHMLRAQRTLEEVEESIAKYIPKETIKIAHARFLSRMNSPDLDSIYLLAVGRQAIRPLFSHLQYPHIKSTWKSTVGWRSPRVTTSGNSQE